MVEAFFGRTFKHTRAPRHQNVRPTLPAPHPRGYRNSLLQSPFFADHPVLWTRVDNTYGFKLRSGLFCFRFFCNLQAHFLQRDLSAAMSLTDARKKKRPALSFFRIALENNRAKFCPLTLKNHGALAVYMSTKCFKTVKGKWAILVKDRPKLNPKRSHSKTNLQSVRYFLNPIECQNKRH